MKRPWYKRIAHRRQPDFVIGNPDDPYLRRWWLIPRNRFLNAYLHHFLHSDDDRALHDHPWVNCSILLEGEYVEHTIAAGGVHHRERCEAGDVKVRRASAAHRIELFPGQECWTLFLTGPILRQWGFHCPQGWKPWKKFVNMESPGEAGPGCG